MIFIVVTIITSGIVVSSICGSVQPDIYGYVCLYAYLYMYMGMSIGVYVYVYGYMVCMYIHIYMDTHTCTSSVVRSINVCYYLLLFTVTL